VKGRGKTPTFCVFPVFSVAVMEKYCDGYGDGTKYFQLGFTTVLDDDVSEASTGVDRKSTRHAVGELQWKDADFLCISSFKRGRYVKVL
jgi:hypothetical protein